MTEDGPGRLSELVSQEVRAWMARQGIKQAELAEALGITQQAVSHRLTGRTSWNLDDLEPVAALLGVSVSELLTSPRHD